MKHKSIIIKNLIVIGAILAIQSLPLFGGPSEEGLSPEIVDLSVEDGKVKISVDFHEPFRWEKTRYESIKTFPMRGGSRMPHTIRFEEKGGMSWRQTDIVFIGNYRVLEEHELEASVSGYLVEIIGVFDPETNLMNFDTLDYVPFFQVPKLIIEQSKDLNNWSRVKLSEPLPKEYQWPKGLSIKLGAELKGTSFFRVKIEEE
tara:strand:- start:2 stop:607 length:606 start_codon:yes stop_codon:yes gene_type:complete